MSACGTTSGYGAGCRCDDCRRVASAYRQKMRHNAAQRDRERERERRAARGQPVRDLLGVESPDWYEFANCRGVPQHTFYPEHGQSTAAAKAVCAECPVSVECLAWALDHGEMHGVWGGASERERKSMRKNWTAA